MRVERFRCATRLVWLGLALALVTGASAGPYVDAVRQSNAAAMQMRRQERAVIVRDRSLPINVGVAANFLLFCRQRRVTSIFLAIYDLPYPRYDNTEVTYRWQRFLLDAHQAGINVFALTGDSSWAYDLGPAYRQLDTIAAYSAFAGPAAGFDGLLFEFPALAQLQGTQPPASSLQPPSLHVLQTGALGGPAAAGTVAPIAPDETGTAPPDIAMSVPGSTETLQGDLSQDDLTVQPSSLKSYKLVQQYLVAVSGISSYLDSRYAGLRLKFGVSFPAWLRSAVRFRDEVKYASDHFVDVSDFVMIHNLPGPTTAIAEVAAPVLRYAGMAGKRVYCRLELAYPLRSVPELISLYGRDELFLERTVADLRGRIGDAPGFAGIALDDYYGYRRLTELVPDPRRRFLLPDGTAPRPVQSQP